MNKEFELKMRETLDNFFQNTEESIFGGKK